jgi:hypothetical protein
MKEQYYILAIVILSSLFITSIGIIRDLIKQRDRFSSMLDNGLGNDAHLRIIIKEQSELMNHYYESYDRLYKAYKASCSDSKDCK